MPLSAAQEQLKTPDLADCCRGLTLNYFLPKLCLLAEFLHAPIGRVGTGRRIEGPVLGRTILVPSGTPRLVSGCIVDAAGHRSMRVGRRRRSIGNGRWASVSRLTGRTQNDRTGSEAYHAGSDGCANIVVLLAVVTRFGMVIVVNLAIAPAVSRAGFCRRHECWDQKSAGQGEGGQAFAQGLHLGSPLLALIQCAGIDDATMSDPL